MSPNTANVRGQGTSGCAAQSPTVTAPAAAPSPSPSVDPGDDDPPGTQSCHLLATAVADGTLMDPGVVDGIVRAGATADAPLVDAGHRLATAYAAAVAAKDATGEPDKIAAVSEAGVEMTKVCEDSGLDTVG